MDDASSSSNRDDGLRALLRVNATLRNKSEPAALRTRKQIWADILEHEMYTITQKVKAAGFREHGRATVDEADVPDVVIEVASRVVRILENFNGNEVGQLRASINQAVEWSVISYARKQATNRAREELVDPAGWDPGNLDPEDRPGFKLADVTSALVTEDQILAVERLKALKILSDRDALVVSRRATGYSSKEIATEMELTPENVDQIFSRATKKLREFEEAR